MSESRVEYFGCIPRGDHIVVKLAIDGQIVITGDDFHFGQPVNITVAPHTVPALVRMLRAAAKRSIGEGL